ncbi:hypothetical protein NW733_05945 [Mycoplasmopsis felis]|uniref:hypothetical protein n=1 Tax=Mycoplasmopsis felis TaxID=33923 RepID=UPI0021E00B57|nr:hypothetical protein [Mycoplasmopsis felis]MCU9932161.1 hypothetical protein [Mycoplasmopsis felis]
MSDFAYLSFIILFFVFSFLFLFKEGPSFKLSYKSIYRGVFVSFLPSLFLVIIYTYLNKILNYSKYGAAVGFFFSIGFFINWYVYFMFLGLYLIVHIIKVMSVHIQYPRKFIHYLSFKTL